jgi:hypothetical protein
LYDNDSEHFSLKLKINKTETNGLVKGQKVLDDWRYEAFEQLPFLN